MVDQSKNHEFLTNPQADFIQIVLKGAIYKEIPSLLEYVLILKEIDLTTVLQNEIRFAG